MRIMIIDDQFRVASDPLHDTRLAITELHQKYPPTF